MLHGELYGSSAGSLLCLLLRDAAGINSPAPLHTCRILHSIIVQSGLDSWTAPSCPVLEFSLLRVYGHTGALQDAENLFSKSQYRDKFSWNNMMKCYGRLGLHHDALLCLDRMQLEGVLPDMFIYATALSECTAMDHDHCKGLKIHSVLTICCGLNMGNIDHVVCTALVNMYGKTGLLEDARKAFDSMRTHDITSWNAILSSYAQNELFKDILLLFEKMQQQEMSPNKVTFVGVLSAFTTQEALSAGMEMHCHTVLYGFESDLNLGNALVNMYGKCGNLENAWRVFQLLQDKNTVSWTSMIASVVQHGRGDEAFVLFEQMEREGELPDKVTYINILSACTDEVTLGQGQKLHALIMVTLPHFDVELKNALVNMYSKCANLEAAQRVFDCMSQRTTITWNAMISAYIQHGNSQDAINLFLQMQDWGQAPDKVTFLGVLTACAQTGSALPEFSISVLDIGRDVHSITLCHGFTEDVTIGNALAHMYKKHGLTMDAWKIFDNLIGRNTVSWNVMISEQGPSKAAVQLYAQMLEEGVMRSKCTVTNLLIASGFPDLIKFGKEMHASMDVTNNGLDVSTGNRLIHMYHNCASMDHAQDVFNSMQEHDKFTWTEMIAGYTNCGQSKMAIWVFCQMQHEGVGSDRVTYVCILSACTNHTGLVEGRCIHASIVGTALDDDVSVGNALINMYGKCGSLKDSHKVFIRMPVHDVVSWSSMIANYAQHGHSKDALEMFHQMQQEQPPILLDEVTFVSVLGACSHSGSVAEGWYWFEFMKKKLFIKPTLDHYNCMVDMLARAGMMEEAENMISDMPFEADVISWMTLLCACRHHVDVERGERSAGHIFRLDPLYLAAYVVLSNIYSTAGRVEDASRIALWMKEKGLNQHTNCSFVEVNGEVHEFYDGDKSHAQNEEIEILLQTLTTKIGDVMNLLPECTNENIEQLSTAHSEKLALAFGIVSTCPGSPLVIITKSHLRPECHMFIKLASKVLSRDITVRNDIHFHYMQNGICSCGDYW